MIDILLGIEELALHPHRVEIVGNLGLFRSPLTNVSILGGRHPHIHPVKMELSHACLMLRRAVTPAHQNFRIKTQESMFQLGDTMGDYIPKTCNN